MGSKLKDEIRQTKPFSGIEQEAVLNIHRTSGILQRRSQQILKQQDLTESQYNVLRILRGAGPEGLRCSDIGERMISHDPDVTRLLERLQRMKLAERRRDAKDRRVIYSRITTEGLERLRKLDPAIESGGKAALGHMNPERIGLLIDLLEEVRLGLTV